MNNLPFFNRACALKPLALAIFTVLSSTATTASYSANAETVVVTANRVGQPASEVLIDHEVISAEEIARAGNSSLAELLQRKRGFEISSNGGAGNYASVFMRGTANSQSVVLVDGVRIGSSTNGGATWAGIPLSQIDHIEIVYGPLSSLYGADAMGGVVQIFTKPGSTFLEPNLEIGAGSHGARRYDFGMSGSSGGTHALRFSVNVSHEEETGVSATKPAAGKYTYDPDLDGYQRDSVSAQLSAQIAKGHELGATFMKSRMNSQFDTGPGYDARDVLGLETWSLYSKNQWLENWKSTLRVANSEDRASSDASYGKSTYDTKQTTYSWQNDIQLGQNLLQLLAEERDERVAATSKALAKTRTTRSYAAAYQLKYEQHLATLSLRHDTISGAQSNTTGNLAYGYRINKQWRFSTSFGTSFRAPSFNELYYPGYGIASNRAEKGRNLEAGLTYDEGDSHLKAALFRNRISDLLVYATECPNKAPEYLYGCAYNLDQAQITGLSLGGTHKLTSQWQLRGAFDWQDAIDQTTRNRLPRRAKVHGNVAVEFDQGPYHVGTELVFADKRFDDVANKNGLVGYGVVNLYGSYDISKGWSVLARWNNIGRKDYEMAKAYQTPSNQLFVSLRFTPN